MKLRYLIAIFYTLTLFTFSCTAYKDVPYFQDLNRDSVSTEKINNFSPLTIQPGDLLAIHVTSLNHEADVQFNYNLERPSGINGISGDVTSGIASENVVYGYLVDGDGNITLPMAGKLKVSGLTTSQIAATLQTTLSDYVSKPIINVRLENFKISVLGDVKNPGSYTINNESVTLSEALALAGDLNTTGIRNNVLIVREIDGTRKYITLDLRSKKTLTSPYYYLRNNDVNYEQPNHDKVSSSDSSFQKASLNIAALSLIAIFVTRN